MDYLHAIMLKLKDFRENPDLPGVLNPYFSNSPLEFIFEKCFFDFPKFFG